MAIRKEKTKGKLTVSRVYNSDFQKEGRLTAELKQKVTTVSYYPSKKIDSNLQDNLFSLSDFGFQEEEYTSVETRVAWIDVPVDMTPEKVTELLDKNEDANLYRILSNEPILNENQLYAIEEGITTLDTFANKQIIRYPANHAKAGEIVLDDFGKPQYRAIFFSLTAKEDIDNRNEVADNFYMSAEIQAELETVENNVVAGQTL